MDEPKPELTPKILLSLLGIPYQERTNRLQMRCPFHGVDAHPSAAFYLSTGLFFCFTEDLTLDVIGFYAKLKEIKRNQAEAELNAELGYEPQTKVRPNELLLASSRRAAEAALGKLKHGTDLQTFARLGENLDRILWDHERTHSTEAEFKERLTEWYKGL